MATCTVDDCDKPRHGRGLCEMHYGRVRTRGTLDLLGPRPKPTIRLWVAMQLYVRARTDECWEDWPYSRTSSDGRPALTYRRRRMTVASYVVFLEKGSFPVCACHRCDNPKCWNPDHLYAGDYSTNALDRFSRRR